MIGRRRKSPLRYLVPALVVGLLLWWARVWPFRRGEAPPPASMPAGGSAAQRAYQGLDPDFRQRVPLEEFAEIFQRMLDPDYGNEPPVIREAVVFDGAGPQRPAARFRVEYPQAGAKAEYHFERVAGQWQLQSFARSRGDWPELPVAAAPAPAPPASLQAPKPAPPEPPAPEPAKPTTKTATAPEPPQPREKPAWPRYYVIQQGDTLSAISRHFYGTTRYWRRILEANPGLRERRLRIGRRIVIPSPPEPLPQKGGGVSPQATPER